jgi:hypothetical protein
VSNIFISYRREDSGGHAGRLCDRLTARFGKARVFMDLQDIAPGQNFAQSIDEMIVTCECVLAVIGPRWLETIQKRAPGGEDFVQHEIAAALRRGITVIPVLVGRARMPPAEDLPAAMSELRYRNAFEVRDERFDDDVARLGDAINEYGVGDDAGVPPAAARALDGDWIAEMQKDGQPSFRIRLTFVTAGESITGMVRYPTGDAPILDARLAGRVLTFHTAHVPQFESTPAIIRFQAEVGDDDIRFTTTDNYGLAKGVARRRPPSP